MSPESRKKVLAICGSTRQHSTNLQIIKAVQKNYQDKIAIELYDSLPLLPHFNPDVADDQTPDIVTLFRKKIMAADGILVCTPEYIFSLPGSLKNAIEWTVSTTIFSNKPVAIITASGLGEKAHESLQLIMKTMEAKMTAQTNLLIQGARAKLNAEGEIIDQTTVIKISEMMASFLQLMTAKKV